MWHPSQDHDISLIKIDSKIRFCFRQHSYPNMKWKAVGMPSVSGLICFIHANELKLKA